MNKQDILVVSMVMITLPYSERSTMLGIIAIRAITYRVDHAHATFHFVFLNIITYVYLCLR
jgi:hypothetical protein